MKRAGLKMFDYIGLDKLPYFVVYTKSLRATAPNAKPKPAYILGFQRSFSLWDAVGFTKTNLDVAGAPMCALDIKAAKDSDAKVNGVVFDVGATDLRALKEREIEYQLIKTTAFDFGSGKPLGECLVFSASKNNGSFVVDSPAQARYLQICLDGAKEYGDTFYREFLETTYVGSSTLDKLPKLVH